jgi:hypothetical protein
VLRRAIEGVAYAYASAYHDIPLATVQSFSWVSDLSNKPASGTFFAGTPFVWVPSSVVIMIVSVGIL